MPNETYRDLKKELNEVLAWYGMKLYEQDGQWSCLSDYYDLVLFAAHPSVINPEHLPQNRPIYKVLTNDH